jgi:5-methylcytosine-specific restriction endonuclease McrA
MGNDARLAFENVFGTPLESHAPARNDTPTRTVHSTPVAPLRYRVEFTASQEYVDWLEEARNLLQHQVPNRDVARVHELAMAVFVEQLRKRRQAATKRSPAPVEERESIRDDGSSPKRTRPERDAVEMVAVSGAFDRFAPERMRDRTEIEESAPERMRQPPVVEGSEPERMRRPLVADGSKRMSEPAVALESALERNVAPRLLHGSSQSLRNDAESHRAPSRHVPAATRRVVWARDGGCCTFSDASGRRCCERSGLEIHHEHAFALGGSTTVENLRLLCRAHNAFFAERDFGHAHVESLRNRGRPK